MINKSLDYDYETDCTYDKSDIKIKVELTNFGRQTGKDKRG